MTTDVFEIDGVETSDSSVISNAFKDYFKSVFTTDNGVLETFDMAGPPLSDIVISEQGVFNLLLKLDVKKSSGPDGVPNEFLKRYAQWVSKYLTILFSKSLKDGQVPDDWVTAKVKPLHKSGNPHSVINYRPISLISTSCKLLEHIIHKHISEFLDKHNILSGSQHGFRKGFSTCTQLVTTVHDFALSINSGKQVDAIFMDFAKAFDTVSHNKLLFKLDLILKNTQLLNWISGYLLNRKQYVSFNEHCSRTVPVDSGVPQGSVLGPLFFLLFINDISHDIPVKVKLYADDCILYSEVENHTDQIHLNDAFQKVIRWCDKWQMSVNFKKTVFIKISHKRNTLHFAYSANNVFLQEVQHYKYLGLWISNDLNWTRHINTVVSSCNYKLSQTSS